MKERMERGEKEEEERLRGKENGQRGEKKRKRWRVKEGTFLI